MDPWSTSYCKVKGKNMKKHLKQWFDEMCRMHISFCICSIIHNNRHITYMIYVDLSYVCRLPTLENFPKVPYRSGQSGRLLKSEAKKAARIPMILGHCHPWGWWLRMLPVVVWSSTIRLNGHPVLNSSVYGDDKDLLCGCMCCLLPHLLHRFNRKKRTALVGVGWRFTSQCILLAQIAASIWYSIRYSIYIYLRIGFEKASVHFVFPQSVRKGHL